MNSSSVHRHQFLIDSNVTLLRRTLDLLMGLGTRAYVTCPSALPGQRIGTHVRHLVEFYECMLDGLTRGQIDYDGRKRGTSVEGDLDAAIMRIQSLIAQLTDPGALAQDSGIYVHVETALGTKFLRPYVLSTIGRELQALLSHTMYHLEWISVVARLQGMALEPRRDRVDSECRPQFSKDSCALAIS